MGLAYLPVKGLMQIWPCAWPLRLELKIEVGWRQSKYVGGGESEIGTQLLCLELSRLIRYLKAK